MHLKPQIAINDPHDPQDLGRLELLWSKCCDFKDFDEPNNMHGMA